MVGSVPRIKAWSVAALVALAAAVLVAGCGGSSDTSGTTTTPGASGGEGANGGASKPATAPNAPAGSKVVSCEVGSAEVKELRATEVDCATAVEVTQKWEQSNACALGEGESRGSCSLGGFRCQAVRGDRGAAVSCARPGEDVSFVADAASLKSGPG